jgi:hypothetical protein
MALAQVPHGPPPASGDGPGNGAMRNASPGPRGMEERLKADVVPRSKLAAAQAAAARQGRSWGS